MAICLSRANELEGKIIRLMEQLNQTTAQLEGLTEVEKNIVDFEYDNASPNGRQLNQWTLDGNEVYGNMDYDEFLHRPEFDNLLGANVHWVYRKGNAPTDSTPYIQGEELISLLESKMDEKNSFSQQTMLENLYTLTGAGIKFSLDDFGTGYSNMQRIASLPLAIVKIDKSFTDRILEDEKTRSIVKFLVELIHDNDMEAIVEGVETKEQEEMLRKMKVDTIQGFYYSRPIPFGAYNELLKENAFEKKGAKK